MENYEDEKYITNEELKIILWNFFEESIVWNFGFVKIWFNQESYVYFVYYPCGKILKLWLEKENILYHISWFRRNVTKTSLLQVYLSLIIYEKKATSGSLIHLGLMQYLILFYPDVFNHPNKNIKWVHLWILSYTKQMTKHFASKCNITHLFWYLFN